MMKSKITTILLLLFFASSFSQDKKKEDIILVYNSENVINKSSNLFKIDNEDFRYLKDKHDKKHVLFENIKKYIISVDELKLLTKQKMKIDKIKDNFIQAYFGKYFNLMIYKKNTKCENEGTLYEVEWVLSITEPEID